MRPKVNFNSDSLSFAPFVLVPSSFPRREFEKALKLQPLINELIHQEIVFIFYVISKCHIATQVAKILSNQSDTSFY